METGDIVVQNGITTITNAADEEILRIISTASPFTSSTIAVDVNGVLPSSAFDIFTARVLGNQVFSLRGDGLVEVLTGGIDVIDGGLTVETDGNAVVVRISRCSCFHCFPYFRLGFALHLLQAFLSRMVASKLSAAPLIRWFKPHRPQELTPVSTPATFPRAALTVSRCCPRRLCHHR